MDEQAPLLSGRAGGREWPRALTLFALLVATSVLQPSVLVALPLVALVVVGGVRRPATLAALLVAVLVAWAGRRDGVWFLERAWALLVGSWFAALSVLRPRWRLTSRTLTAVLFSAGTVAAVLAARAGAWGVVDWAVRDRVMGAVATFVQVAGVVRNGGALSPALVAALYETAELQVRLFPALTALGSMAALGVAWWVYAKLSGLRGVALAPLKDFRFNDHLVWLFLAGLATVLLADTDGASRLGSNTLVFMGALYALRGAAVVVFLSGGFGWFGTVVWTVALMFMAPVLVTAAMVVGLGDTWLDMRGRVARLSAR